MSTMRIITTCNFINNNFYVKIEINGYSYCLIDAFKCHTSSPYSGIKIEGEQVDDFIKFVRTISETNCEAEELNDN